MTLPRWSPTPYTVHVNGDPSQRVAAAEAVGGLVIRWSLAGIRNGRELDASAAEVFAFPFPSSSLDGLVDMIAGLEWLDVEGGVLLVIDASDARPSVVVDVASILPTIGDRWRSGAGLFEAYLIGVADTAAVAQVLEQNNLRLDEFGRRDKVRPDTYRVPVIIGG